MKPLIAITIVAAVLLTTGIAQAQLRPEDIEALRQQGQREGWTFTLGPNPATAYPPEALCGARRPPDWLRLAPPPPSAEGPRDLGESFSWENLFPAQPVRDQGGCGSCWAFGTCGVLEYKILIQDRKSRDLSEQWLLSCNEDGWNCSAGGWFAHDYHQDGSGKTDPCGDDGAVYEADFPYTASDLTPCNCPYPHRYWLDDWHYISSGTPTVEELKQAIVDHGPVAVSMATNAAFMAYTGGVFNACGGPECDDPNDMDHIVVLVGWDDNQGSDGVWFLRNSWGPGWGENGYARIEYNCCFVERDANWVKYTGGYEGVWVDFAYGGTEYGTYWHPYNTLSEGINAVATGGTVSFRAGSTSATPTITKPLTLMGFDGNVVIGK